MKRLPIEEIKAAFVRAAQTKAQAQDLTAMKSLSGALADLQAAGIDVELCWHGAAAETPFAMALGANVASSSQRSSGILRIGHAQFLAGWFDLVRLHSDGGETWHPIALLAVSELDIRGQGLQGAIRSNAFHLSGEDGEPFADFQRFVIGVAATQAAIAENDPHGAFSSSRKADSLNPPVTRLNLGRKG